MKTIFIFLTGITYLFTSYACYSISNPNRSQQALESMQVKDYFITPGQIELAKAVESNQVNKIVELINNGENPNQKNIQDMTVLFWSFIKGKKDSFQTLLENGADPNIILEGEKSKHDTVTALALASIHEDPFYLTELIKHGGNVDMPLSAGSGRTIIYDAMLHRRIKNIELLVNNGANLNRQSHISGNTILIDAILANSFGVALKLLELGSDPTIKNKNGQDVNYYMQTFEDRDISFDSETEKDYLKFKEALSTKFNTKLK